MKLLNCTACHDIVALTNRIRSCQCQQSAGRYHYDKVNALISGQYARVLGMINDQYIVSLTVDVVPFTTYYKWFPIRSEPEHHVRKVDDLSQPDDVLIPLIRLSAIVVRCKKCDEVLLSRANHDFHACSCGQIEIDGDSVFRKDDDITTCGCHVLGDPEHYELIRVILAPTITRKVLWTDFYLGQNEFHKLVPAHYTVVPHVFPVKNYDEDV